ncbi:MAG: hypothetical protein HKO53_07980, partial [Gemmatimonadetes bacterium]|nr:hypothetical protein [Gemmatimonadota bacterium]
MRTPPSGLFFATVAFSITLAPAAAQEPLASPDGHALPLAPTRSLQF